MIFDRINNHNGDAWGRGGIFRPGLRPVAGFAMLHRRRPALPGGRGYPQVSNRPLDRIRPPPAPSALSKNTPGP